MIAVELRDGGGLIGNVYLGRREFQSMELGFVFNREYWGNGYASESCRAVLEKTFGEGVHRVYAECDPENENSWRRPWASSGRGICGRMSTSGRTKAAGPSGRTHIFMVSCTNNNIEKR